MNRKVSKILFIIADTKEELDVRQKLADVRSATFEIVTVRGLVAALALLSQHSFDVILLDLAIRDCQGVEGVRRLLGTASDIPVVVVSQAYDEAEAFEAVRAGAEDYTVANRMNAVAFERVILYAIERRVARQRMALQFAVSRVLAEADTLDSAAGGILSAVCEFSNLVRGEVWKADTARGRLVLVNSWSRVAEEVPDADTARSRPAIAKGDGVVGLAWETGMPQGLPESAAPGTSKLKIPDNSGGSGRIAVALPLGVGSGTLGVLALFGDGARIGGEDSIKLLTSVGAQLGQFMARKSAEEERESLGTERLSILDSTSEGIYGLDQAGCITFMNKSATRILGCRLEEALGKSEHVLFHHTHPDGKPYPASDCPIAKLIASGDSHRTDKEYFWRPNGSHFAVDYSAKPVFKDGAIVGAVVSFTDISEKRGMEVELRHAQKLEAVGRLAAGIAHEINTPIQFIGDIIRFLQNSFQDILALVAKYDEAGKEAATGSAVGAQVASLEDFREKIDWAYLRAEIPKATSQALDGVQRVATIVRAMKEFSHVDRSAEKTAADINKAIESTLIVARNEVKYVADVETDFGAIPSVICHLGDLNQVFLNLLVNAAHAIADASAGTDKKGRIRVKTVCEADFVVVSIEDTGTGIPESVRGKVFEPFFTTKEVGKGTGQGLALARAIVVEKHGGSLTFDTQLGKGTTFYVRLPVNGVPESREAVPV
jgi:PAS domain S-box-containing protein